MAEYSDNISVCDPLADRMEVKKHYGIDIISEPENSHKYDVIILGVAHKEFLGLDLKNYLKDNGIVYDVKSVLSRDIVDGRL